jgi:hypothetical protein
MKTGIAHRVPALIFMEGFFVGAIFFSKNLVCCLKFVCVVGHSAQDAMEARN